MKYPNRTSGALKENILPQFSGGVNLRDGANMDDSCLSDALNVWYKDGLLRTRPAFSFLSAADFSVSGEVESVKAQPHGEITKEGKTLVSVSAVSRCERLKGEQETQSIEEGESEYETVILQTVYFMWQDGQKSEPLPQITLDLATESPISYFVTESDGVLYCFFQNREIYRLAPESESGWAKVTAQELYAPVIYVGGIPQADGSISFALFEGRNLLTPYYRMRFAAVNENTDQSTLYWRLPHSLPSGLKGVITAEFTDTSGNTTTHTVTLKDEGDVFFEQENAGPLYFFVKRDSTFGFSSTPESTEPVVLPLKDYKADNITVTALTDYNAALSDKVFLSTKSCIFSGTSSLQSGSSRLFLAGNTAREYASVVLWSGLDNPLYFPENCSLRVGNSAKGVTALARFEDKLIIFKEHEIYYTYYAENQGITAEDILSSGDLDYTSLSVYFPLVSLNSSIGCDCADTILLCRNRLVFTHSSGCIYTLTGTNQYSSMQVYSLSDAVEGRLKEEGESLKGAKAVDFCGHYVLCVGKRMYALNYTSYGFVYISSFSKESYPTVPIYMWELPSAPDGYFRQKDSIAAIFPVVLPGKLCVITAASSLSLVHDIGFDLKEDKLNINKLPIESKITTKSYSLGSVWGLKNIYKVCVCIACSDTAVVRFRSAWGETVSYIYPTAREQDGQDYPRPQIFLNPIRLTERIGFTIESRGAWELDNLSIVYKSLGGAY